MRTPTVSKLKIVVALLAGAAASTAAQAQEPLPDDRLILELNGLAPSESGCRFTFVARNRLAVDLDKAGFEMVIFDKAGLVERMTVFNFSDLPAAKTKVRQFDLAGVACDAVGEILVNDAPVCAGPAADAKTCIAKLEPRSRAAIAFIK